MDYNSRPEWCEYTVKVFLGSGTYRAEARVTLRTNCTAFEAITRVDSALMNQLERQQPRATETAPLIVELRSDDQILNAEVFDDRDLQHLILGAVVIHQRFIPQDERKH